MYAIDAEPSNERNLVRHSGNHWERMAAKNAKGAKNIGIVGAGFKPPSDPFVYFAGFLPFVGETPGNF